MSGTVRVLYVDDPAVLDRTADRLEQAHEQLSVVGETAARAGLDRLDDGVDCVVSAYDLPGLDGVAFLERVRDDHPDLPFVLFARAGSEAVASEAVSAGVTDYVRKVDADADTDQPETLADRVVDAVERHRDRERAVDRAERFRALVENSTDIVTVLDENGVVEYDSPSIEGVLGYDPDERVGESAFEYVHPDDRREVVERFTDLVEGPEGATRRAEFRARSADGEWVWVESVATNRTDSAVEGYVVTTREVTGQKERERKLEEEREKYSTLVSQSHDGVVIVQDAVYKFVNDRVLEMTGYDRDTLLGMPFYEVMAPEYRDLVRERYEQRVEGENPPGKYDIEVLTADGERLQIALTVARVQYEGEPATMANFRDITERKRRERRLRGLNEATREFMKAETETELAEQVVEAAKGVLKYPCSAVRLLSEEDNTLEPVAVTDEARESFGDRPVYEVGEGPAGTAFERGEPVVTDDFRDVDDEYDREPGASSIHLPIGEYGVLGMADDEPGAFDHSDEQIASILAANAEASLQRLERERQVRRQNERLSEFASIVSHDLRNPLNVASGRLELARETGDLEHLEGVASALDRMGAIVDDVLTMAREGQSVGETERVPLAKTARDAWENVETRDATLRVDGDGTFEADPRRLRHVFENLFRNAVEHGSTSPPSQTPEDAVEHGSTSPGSQTRQDAVDHAGPDVTVRVGVTTDGFFVEDDGPGIPPEDREAVFEPGFSTSDDGTGFGLNIVKQMVDAHGWDIAVTDGADGGARFDVTGPRLFEEVNR